MRTTFEQFLENLISDIEKEIATRFKLHEIKFDEITRYFILLNLNVYFTHEEMRDFNLSSPDDRTKKQLEDEKKVCDNAIRNIGQFINDDLRSTPGVNHKHINFTEEELKHFFIDITRTLFFGPVLKIMVSESDNDKKLIVDNHKKCIMAKISNAAAATALADEAKIESAFKEIAALWEKANQKARTFINISECFLDPNEKKCIKKTTLGTLRLSTEEEISNNLQTITQDILKILEKITELAKILATKNDTQKKDARELENTRNIRSSTFFTAQSGAPQTKNPVFVDCMPDIF